MALNSEPGRLRRWAPQEWPAAEDLAALRQLYERMPTVVATQDGAYTYTDEARDFRSVFGTEAGLRVLSRIAAICDPVAVGPQDADKPGRLAFLAGMRFVMHEINRSFAGRGAPPMREDEHG